MTPRTLITASTFRLARTAFSRMPTIHLFAEKGSVAGTLPGLMWVPLPHQIRFDNAPERVYKSQSAIHFCHEPKQNGFTLPIVVHWVNVAIMDTSRISVVHPDQVIAIECGPKVRLAFVVRKFSQLWEVPRERLKASNESVMVQDDLLRNALCQKVVANHAPATVAGHEMGGASTKPFVSPDREVHADTFAVSLAYVSRLPTMASTKDANRSSVWRFTSPSLSLHANSWTYRSRCLGLT